MDYQEPHLSEEKPGLFAGLGSMAKNLLGLFMSRIELAALEFSEVRTALLKIVLLGALGLVAAWFALAYWSILVVVLAWPAMGWIILLVMALVFTAATAGLFMYLKSMLDQGKLSMPATMAELRHDRDTLL
ncbi:MAG: phage holin family protein [Janthinobacterium lividum]